MLQQTQVERVIPFYKRFLKAFPTLRALAKSPLGDVLRLWQGLGYNRRAKMLHDAAKIVVARHSGKLPASYEELSALPGVGDYTAKAIRVFALNQPEGLIETNVRSVFLHHFFSRKKSVHDRQILQLTVVARGRMEPRRWYAALMDYGSHLKSLHPNPSRRSAHHAKQKSFRGSDREIRGAILRAHLRGAPLSDLPFKKGRVRALTRRLKSEGLII
jgi:A/G-specific adenine glycosylase